MLNRLSVATIIINLFVFITFSAEISLTDFNQILNVIERRDSLTGAIITLKSKKEKNHNQTSNIIGFEKYIGDTIKIICRTYGFNKPGFNMFSDTDSFFVTSSDTVMKEFIKFNKFKKQRDSTNVSDSLQRIDKVAKLTNNIVSIGMHIDTVLKKLNCPARFEEFYYTGKIAYFKEQDFDNELEYIQIECNGYSMSIFKYKLIDLNLIKK